MSVWSHPPSIFPEGDGDSKRVLQAGSINVTLNGYTAPCKGIEKLPGAWQSVR